MADPVENAFGYRITGMLVSNFITSAYFEPGGMAHTKSDFGGVLTATFSVAKGGYINVFRANPSTAG